MNRTIIHVLMALILVICAVSPFVESALDSQDNMFATGYDGESTLAIVVLLLELVLSLANLLVFLCPSIQVKERFVTKQARLTSTLCFCYIIPDFSSSVPLRI